MDNVIIIGNGLDLDLGWKTSFGDFYRKCYKKYDRYSGNKYIQEMTKKNCWYDIEGYIRHCIIKWYEHGRDITEKDALHAFWHLSQSFLFEYLQEQMKNFSEQINISSCAYSFLMNMHQEMLIYSFNYTNPYKYIDESLQNKYSDIEIKHVHGSLYDELPVNSKLLLGADTGISSLSGNDEYIKVMIKQMNRNKTFDFTQEMIQANRIVFFGHSLGITDSDYFKPAFNEIIAGNSSVKNITIITYDADAEVNIRNNTQSWEVDLNKVNMFVPVNFIYTQKGANDMDFLKLLEVLKRR